MLLSQLALHGLQRLMYGVVLLSELLNLSLSLGKFGAQTLVLGRESCVLLL